ncbi:MAG TPA: DoxX family protein [Opitutaceae bacterium]|nr:DoxX family protein [Opitutaceae bacterium]HRJ47207.1 DoxX family protein [Opitutaceae bacterium]
MKTLIQNLINTRQNDWSPLALRLTLGLVMAGHGAQKLFGWFGGYGLQATAGFFAETLGLKPGLFWAVLAAGGEFFGGLLLILGLATRLAAVNTAIIMLVAIVTVHPNAFFLPNGMEFALSLLAMSIALLFTGGGALSADARLNRTA